MLPFASMHSRPQSDITDCGLIGVILSLRCFPLIYLAGAAGAGAGVVAAGFAAGAGVWVAGAGVS